MSESKFRYQCCVCGRFFSKPTKLLGQHFAKNHPHEPYIKFKNLKVKPYEKVYKVS